MRIAFVLLGTLCLFSGALCQGFAPPSDVAQQNQFQRQLTVAQQTHILNDVQQHQHRFNVHSPQAQQQQEQQQYLAQQQGGEAPVNSLQQDIINQRPPPLQPQQSNPIRFPQNNFRNGFQSQAIPLLGNPGVLQHHTQTNFIPNFAQQSASQTQASSNNQFQRSLQNQLQLPSQQPPASNPTQQSKQPIDQEFHAQNFVTLRNHYSQQPTGSQAPPPPPSNQQFIQSQPQYSPTSQFTNLQQYQNGPQQQNQQFQNVPGPQEIQQQVPAFQHSALPPNEQNILSFQQQIQQQQQQQQQQQTAPTQQYQQAPIQYQGNQQQLGIPQYQNQQFKVVNQFQQFPQNGNGGASVTPELEAKQKLIQKHEAFVQKQYEKQQNKVKQQHDEFLQKQQSIKDLGLTVRQPIFDRTAAGANSRPVGPSDTNLFDYALRKYYEEHPTTPPTTTTTTTATTKASRINKGDDALEHLLQAHRKDIYGQLKLESEKSRPVKRTKDIPKSTKAIGREELLKQLKLALADNPQPSLGNKSFDSMDIVLPSGEKVQVIRTTDPNLITAANSNRVQLTLPSPGNFQEQPVAHRKSASRTDTSEIIRQIAPDHPRDLILPGGEKVEIVPAPVPPSISGLKELPADISSLYSQNFGDEAQIISADGPPSIEELSKRGLIPEGYEIVQQPAPGSRPQSVVQPLASAPKKAPTFVYLEEQPDGSFKVQGVKANGDDETKTSGAEVDSILARIKQGDLELPPSVTKIQLPGEETRQQTPNTTPRRPLPPTTRTTTTTTTAAPRISYQSTYPSSTSSPYFTASTPRVTFPSSTVSPYSTLNPLRNTASTPNLIAASSTHATTFAPPITHSHHAKISSNYAPTEPTLSDRLMATTLKQSSPQEDLIQILKSNGLYAMAKYLRQSGLDGILNETGPYTVFAPTDKAFKNLLIQLGGPERAEEKFKANPRLLSGLLLHHVIPGAFEISTLQDEMTGVSLAGTQLRVNQYTMHDQEWNDVLITTINGAMVVNDKQDVKIPQGIAHGVDRVMFPLPVGDLLQTLQSDRESRFTSFLKILYASGLSEILQNKGTKTYTVFAPSDKAFSGLESNELQKLYTDKEVAQGFAMRHIVPGTLFSAGMRFYQVKDSLLDGQTITLQKTSSGKIRVNESQMVTSNIPATNGVIHALDGLL